MGQQASRTSSHEILYGRGAIRIFDSISYATARRRLSTSSSPSPSTWPPKPEDLLQRSSLLTRRPPRRPLQGSLRTPSLFLVGPTHYTTISMLLPFLTFVLFGAAIVTNNLSRQLNAVAEEANPPPPPMKKQRAHNMLALLLSTATTAIAMASSVCVLEVHIF